MARTLDPEKRQAILNAARSVLLRDGYAAAKISEIAAEAGLAPGTLYLYFDSKEAIANAIGQDFFKRLSSEFSKIIKKLHDPDGVDALMNWALRIAVQERDTLAMVRATKATQSKSSQGANHRRELVQQIAVVLEELMAKNVIRRYDNVVSLADMVLEVVHRVVMSHACFEDIDAEEVKDTAVTMLHHALFTDDVLKSRSMPAPAASKTK